jgi:hypothetical protein
VFTGWSVPASVTAASFEDFCAIVILVFFAGESRFASLFTIFIHFILLCCFV